MPISKLSANDCIIDTLNVAHGLTRVMCWHWPTLIITFGFGASSILRSCLAFQHQQTACHQRNRIFAEQHHAPKRGNVALNMFAIACSFPGPYHSQACLLFSVSIVFDMPCFPGYDCSAFIALSALSLDVAEIVLSII